MAQTKKGNSVNSNILESCKWIGCTAIGVVIGLTMYKKFISNAFYWRSPDVNRIIDNKWEIPVIACDENGASYITKEYFDLEDKGDIGKLSKEISVATLKFRTTPHNYCYDWHRAPKQQFIINLDAGVHITSSSGESILLHTGQVFMVKDVTGQGHVSRCVGTLPRKS
eukprot:610974_1